ncbi:MAG: TonB-dependent receptor [Pseudomonadota bacterium]
MRLLALWAFNVLLAASLAQAGELTEADFLGGDLTVLTASRLAQPVMDAPNAISVLDRTTIEASGYHNITDLFRLIPGMYVGQKTGWYHSVSHTMADEFSHRMQVLVDGRSIYLASIGGPRWDTLPLAIDDIERIEVVRGPNAATFGANAFTGVINIITRHPDDVRGRMLHLLGGDPSHREGWFRWAGGSEAASHRVTVGRREDGGFKAQLDDERSNVLNYRGHFALSETRGLDLQFGLLTGTRGVGEWSSPTNRPHDQDLDSSHFQADYRVQLSPASEFLAKGYFSHLNTAQRVPVDGTLIDALSGIPGAAYFDEDILSQRWHGEAQLNTDHGNGVRTVVGGFLREDIVGSRHFFNTDANLSVESFGLFGHMEWRWSPRWLMNLGAFWEDYGEVGGRLSPRATLHWQPSPRHAFRIGVSRAYRNPFLVELEADKRVTILDAAGNPLFTTLPHLLATNAVEPEQMLSRELGYQGRWPESGVEVDLRVFRERISKYINFECPPVVYNTGPKSLCSLSANVLGIPPLGAGLVARDVFNLGHAVQTGFESQINWRVNAETRLIVNYAFLDVDSQLDEKWYSPRHLAGLHLMHETPGGIGLMLSRYWTSAFEPIGEGRLPGMRRWDLSLSKRFKLGDSHARLALGVENLGKDYQEFSPDVKNTFETRGYAQVWLDL